MDGSQIGIPCGAVGAFGDYSSPLSAVGTVGTCDSPLSTYGAAGSPLGASGTCGSLVDIQRSLDFCITSLKNDIEMLECVASETTRLIVSQNSSEIESKYSIESQTLNSIDEAVKAFKFALHKTNVSYKNIHILICDEQRKTVVKRRNIPPPDLYCMN